ncbi:MAG: hypothetical protein ABW034_22145 [Steroidobacteraceae bacterium]
MKVARAAPNQVAQVLVLVLALAETSVDFVHAGRLPTPKRGNHLRLIEAYEQLLVCFDERDFPKVWNIPIRMLHESAESVSALDRRNSKVWNSHSFLMGDYTEALLHMPGRQKRAAAIAYQLAAHIRRTELAPGTQISLSAAGVDERSVSRAVLREAIRLLDSAA